MAGLNQPWGQTIWACPDGPPPVWQGGSERAIFLDRDGTLVENRPYNADPDQIVLLPGVLPGLQQLQAAGYLLIVVTNQSGIARGYFDQLALTRVHERLNELLLRANVRIAAYYFCPHHTEGRRRELARPCLCRKPGSGMIWRAAADWSVDLPSSWLIGDAWTDVQAAEAAGCRPLRLGHCPHPTGAPPLATLADASLYIVTADSARTRHRASSIGD